MEKVKAVFKKHEGFIFILATLFLISLVSILLNIK